MIKSAFPAILNVDELVYYFPHIYFTKTIYKLVEKCRIQPVYVIDVASAIMASLKDDGASMGKTYELGGPQVMTLHELVLSLSLSDYNTVWFCHYTPCGNKKKNSLPYKK